MKRSGCFHAAATLAAAAGYTTCPSEVIGSIEALLAFDFDYLVLGLLRMPYN